MGQWRNRTFALLDNRCTTDTCPRTKALLTFAARTITVPDMHPSLPFKSVCPGALSAGGRMSGLLRLRFVEGLCNTVLRDILCILCWRRCFCRSGPAHRRQWQQRTSLDPGYSKYVTRNYPRYSFDTFSEEISTPRLQHFRLFRRREKTGELSCEC